MKETDELVILGEIRTLLALERNYLAEERTAFAELRTGLTLALIGPPASTVIAVIFSALLFERSTFLELFAYMFFATLTIVGVWMSYHSGIKLKKIKKKKRVLETRRNTLIRSSTPAQHLLGDYLTLDRNTQGIQISQLRDLLNRVKSALQNLTERSSQKK